MGHLNMVGVPTSRKNHITRYVTISLLQVRSHLFCRYLLSYIFRAQSCSVKQQLKLQRNVTRRDEFLAKMASADSLLFSVEDIQARQTVTITSILLTLVTITFGLRLYVRARFTRSWGLDDTLLSISYVSHISTTRSLFEESSFLTHSCLTF